MSARELMRALPPPVPPATTVASALALPELPAGAWLVVAERGTVAGAIARATLEHAQRLGLGDVAVRDLLLQRVPHLDAHATTAEIGETLRREHAALAVVVDDSGRAVGTVRRDDLREAPVIRIDEQERRLAAAVARAIDSPARIALGRLARWALDHGGRAYLVGGTVRDLLLERGARDLDVVVDVDLEAEDLGRALGASVRSHAAFGTATLDVDGTTRIDVARARAEYYETPGALPVVRPASLEEDLRRRDFTVNALALALEPGGTGHLLDPLGGVADLEARCLRVHHPLSFVEDPTRMLRGVALEVRLGFALEPGSLRVLRAAVRGNLLDRISPARLRRELQRMLLPEHAACALARLAELGLLRAIDPALGIDAGDRARLSRVRDVPRHAREGIDIERAWAVGLGLLLVGRGPAAARDVIARLRPDRHERGILESASERVPSLLAWLEKLEPPRASAIHAACHPFATEVLLLALAAARPGSGNARCIVDYLERWRHVRLVIGGHDLLAAGIPPGEAISRGLAAALAAKLDGLAPDRAAELTLALAAARSS